MKPKSMLVVALAAGLALVAPGATAQVTDDWQFRAVLYGYFPDIGGSTVFPAGTGGNIDVSARTLIDNSSSRSWAWSRFGRGVGAASSISCISTSGGSESQTRNLTVLGRPPPVGVTGNLDLDIKGSVVTFGGEYAAIADPAASVDLVAGARLISLKQTLLWNFSADLPSGTGPARSGNTEVKADQWDGIVGVKGRLNFGANREWFVPYYLDAGTGESEFTWQAIGGIGYAFKWGQVIAAWRYLDYKFKSGSAIESLNFSGPAVGVAFNW